MIQLPYLSKSRLIMFGAIGVVLLILIVVAFLGLTAKKIAPVANVTLNVWGIFQNSKEMRALESDYQARHPNVKLTYRNFSDPADYESTIVNALAAGDGPDIFFINNTWLPRHIEKLVPAPADIVNSDFIRKNYVDTVSDDFVVTGRNGIDQVYGIPLSLDSLSLFYNREMFNSAGITIPPATWSDFIKDVQKLRVIDSSTGRVNRAGAAIGTADNVLRSTDILSALMLQSGVKMTNGDRTAITFLNSGGGSGNSAADALDFYTSFANPSKIDYTWSRQMNYSVDAFTRGETAMMFGYAYAYNIVKQKAPYLDFGIAPLPQVSVGPQEPKVNYANYWGLVVTKRTIPDSYRRAGYGCVGARVSPRPIAATPCWYAWDFITDLTQPRLNKDYLTTMQLPAAERNLITWQQQMPNPTFPDLKIIALEGLTAKNWYQPDSRLTEQYLADAIKAVLLKNVTPYNALQEAESKMNVLFQH